MLPPLVGEFVLNLTSLRLPSGSGHCTHTVCWSNQYSTLPAVDLPSSVFPTGHRLPGDL